VRTVTRALVLAFAFASHGVATGGIIEVGDLNIIDHAGNPSDGLRYLEMTYSAGLTQAAALASAQAAYPDARLATASEWDDLFLAAGIAYDGALTAADGFALGGSPTISSAGNYDGGALRDTLGVAATGWTWTDPDGSNQDFSIRDLLQLTDTFALIHQNKALPPSPEIGWMIVSEATAVPEPSSLTLLTCLGVAGLIGRGWRRKRKQANAGS